MALRIDPDHRRFREIVRGKIKQDLRKYISQGELIGRKGKDLVSIPLPQINCRASASAARTRRRRAGAGRRRRQPGQGRSERRRAGQGRRQPGEHILEVELSLDELAQILGEELELPRIEPKGKQRIIAQKDKYIGIRRAGPGVAAPLQAHVPGGAAPADHDRHLRSRAAR